MQQYRNIQFSKAWNKTTIRNLVKNNSYLSFANHTDLKALCICLCAENETECVPDYEELTYIVPKKWLKRFVKKEFNVCNFEKWLQEEYTSEQSEVVFSKALSERQVVMVDFC